MINCNTFGEMLTSWNALGHDSYYHSWGSSRPLTVTKRS